MFLIDTYKDYCKAIAFKDSDNPTLRNEAKKALGILKQTDLSLYQEYKERLENKTKVERAHTHPSTLAERQIFLKEHPEIDIASIREKLRTSLLKGRYGLGMAFSVPFWMNEADVVASLDQLDPAELITGNGKPVPRETVLKRCLRKTIEERRFDEDKLRQLVASRFSSYYNNNTITLRDPMLFDSVMRMLKNEATAEELMKIDRPDMSFSIDDLVRLINSKDLQVTNEDKIRWEKRQRKKAQKEAKKQRQQERKTRPMK